MTLGQTILYWIGCILSVYDLFISVIGISVKSHIGAPLICTDQV